MPARFIITARLVRRRREHKSNKELEQPHSEIVGNRKIKRLANLKQLNTMRAARLERAEESRSEELQFELQMKSNEVKRTSNQFRMSPEWALNGLRMSKENSES